jgi:hypothetical protein
MQTLYSSRDWATKLPFHARYFGHEDDATVLSVVCDSG